MISLHVTKFILVFAWVQSYGCVKTLDVTIGVLVLIDLFVISSYSYQLDLHNEQWFEKKS